MKRHEHLLTILGEECAEVAQRCSKALRFGLDEVQPGQDLTNGSRIVLELMDLLAVLQMLSDEGVLDLTSQDTRDLTEQKKAKVERFLDYSRTCGTLTT